MIIQRVSLRKTIGDTLSFRNCFILCSEILSLPSPSVQQLISPLAKVVVDEDTWIPTKLSQCSSLFFLSAHCFVAGHMRCSLDHGFSFLLAIGFRWGGHNGYSPQNIGNSSSPYNQLQETCLIKCYYVTALELQPDIAKNAIYSTVPKCKPFQFIFS